MKRDPFGERPLYYAETAAGLRTASSVWRLLEGASLPRALDPSAVAAALCGRLDAGRSLFQGVRCVPPGHELTLGPSGPSAVPYWQPPLDGGIAHDVEAQRLELLRRLRLAVGMRSHRAACSLSGGLDSGGLLALLAEDGTRPRAYTLVDDFALDEECSRAKALASRFGAEHVLVPVSEAELPDHVVETVRACEDLVWNGRAVATLRLFRGIRDAGDTAVLSGVGADEVFCGNPAALRSFEGRSAAEHALARSLLASEAVAALPAEAASVTPEGVDPLLWRQDRFIRTVLPESTLPPECRTSAALGVEVRLPYLDTDLAEFGLRLPLSLRARGGTGKLLLREALRDLLPEEVRTLTKAPRLAPSGGRSPGARERWLSLYDAWLSPERLQDLVMLDASAVKGLLEGFRHAPLDDPGRTIQDAVLMRLTSVAILVEELRRCRDTLRPRPSPNAGIVEDHEGPPHLGGHPKAATRE